MSQALESARQESSGIRKYFLTGYYLLTRSIALSAAFFGLLLALFGVTLAPERHYIVVTDGFWLELPTAPYVNELFGAIGLGDVWPSHDILAPMIVVWGTTVLLFGLVVFAVMWANRLYARLLRA